MVSKYYFFRQLTYRYNCVSMRIHVGPSNLNSSSRIRFISNSSSSGGPILQGPKKHTRPISVAFAYSYRLSFVADSPPTYVARLSLTEFLRTLLSLLSHRPRADQYSSLSPSAFSPPLSFFSRFQTSLQHASTYTLSFATLPAFLHTITLGWAYTLRLL